MSVSLRLNRKGTKDRPYYKIVAVDSRKRRDGRYIDASGQSFRDFLAGRLPALPGEVPTLSDWADHLTTIFPEVRLKTYLEMRGADAGPWSRLCALPAFWAGIFYCDAALEAAWSLVRSWTAEEREARIARFHRPYHAAIKAELDRMEALGLVPLIVSIHSSTTLLASSWCMK